MGVGHGVIRQDPMVILLLGILLLFVIAIIRLVNRPKPGDPFTCRSCRNTVYHSHRTIRAWMRGYRLRCASCHTEWLRRSTLIQLTVLAVIAILLLLSFLR